ncbi:hypothetical protein F5144DRAFT_489420 [Chaetomium tenue]|uniref:Uncharacterized protein n=1 Tax=Chaetomium tenue TaxID=1854479 RepID=A0ACB7P8F7_9PEZI|nr:hypothetical protein F5144DRAFT_489420 [Chaetomium globosum]
MTNVARRAVPAHLAEHEDDDHAGQRGYIKGTDFSLPYFSQWSRLHESEASDGLLRHVSCGYLSTHGVPPTLLALKQHAQSLCVLIHALNPTLKSAEITGGNPAKAGSKKKGQAAEAAGAAEDSLGLKYKLNDAFDFLTDLSVPYTNDDPNHHKPLTGLANEVRGRHEALGTTYHCPFAEHKPRGQGEKQKPYANHHNLIMHANACLERLDHEFSSTGGLMSLLPTTTTTTPPTTHPHHPTTTDLTNARNSLLGQWLHFTQTLVARMHELERAYGNALDALAGEAAIPHQALAAQGPDGRATGRVVAYPQDRWVLVNAGDEVFEAVHRLLDREEGKGRVRERVWRGNGVVGDGLWVGKDGGKGGGGVSGGVRDYARGIVPVDVMTRYYRLAGSGRNTLFVVPAWEQHPGVEASRETAAAPTVVACPQPKFPERATELEKRYTARINHAQRIELEALRVRREAEELRGEVGVLRRQNETLARSRDALMLAVGEGGVDGDGMKLAGEVHKQRERAAKAEREFEVARVERNRALAREESLRQELDELRRELAAIKGNSMCSRASPVRDGRCAFLCRRIRELVKLDTASFPTAYLVQTRQSTEQCGAKRGDHHYGLLSIISSPLMPLSPFFAGRAMLTPSGAGALPGGASTSPSSVRGSAAATRRHVSPGPGHRQAAFTKRFAFAALGLATRVSADPMLPYTPTTILLPPDGSTGSGTAYIFAPSGDARNAVDFLALNVSSLRTSALEPTKLSSSLPFLSADPNDCTTFAPTLLRNGTIAVLAGDCASTSTSTLWTYTPGHTNTPWTQHAITPSTSWDNAQSGPYHLGGVLNFSPQLSPALSEPTLYLYGGMCPFPNASTTTWQSKATYSNRMLRLTPPQPPTTQNTNNNNNPPPAYTLTYATPHGQLPPVAEAGFSLTELAPSLSNRSSSGSNGATNVVVQQTSHVLLGGHTQGAFVGMAAAALWSLPEETWSFVRIAPPAPPAAAGKPDLARLRGAGARRVGRRGVDDGAEVDVGVDSRSGHTAVLSEDGTRLVVYGGWVGDVGQAAEPQLAVVRIGVGLGDWQWEVPDQGPGGGGGGVYGHGAVVLPGNVMMVYGGYGISGGGAKRQVGGGQGMFYNITSGSWSDVYVSPLITGDGDGSGGVGNGSGTVGGGGNDGSGSSGSDGDDSNPDNSSLARQIGLGVGLGVGLLLLAIAVFFGFRWFRRRQKRRAARDETLHGLSQGVNGSLPRGIGDDDEMLERDHSMGMFPWAAGAARDWYTGGDDPYSQGQRSLGYETLRSGSRPHSLYIPPPPSASTFSHRPKGAKGLHQPTSSYDFTPLTRSPNRIEPIYEADEDEEGDLGKGYPLSPDKEERDDGDDDPFLTPTVDTPVGARFPAAITTNANSPTPTGKASGDSGGQHQDPDVQGWVSNVDASTPAPNHQYHAPTRRPSQSQNTAPPPPPPLAETTSTTVAVATGRVSPLRRGASAKSAKSAAGRHSLVSAPTDSSSSVAATDDGRTESGLSERSAFSFVRGAVGGGAGGSGSGGAAGAGGSSVVSGAAGGGGNGTEDRALLSRLHTTLATTVAAAAATATAAGAGEGRAGSSGAASANSGNSYNTARSNFAALQAEGPGLLLGRRRQDREEAAGAGEDDDYAYLPGSPGKNKPRRSWFGSLRRVFSGGTPESGSNASGESFRGESPTREGLLVYEGGSPDYDGRSYGVGLQKRRQGREAWLGGDGNGDEEEWDRDLERAAEQRTVQIMFTVPREQLRVVNAEVEREESVLIVDPDDEEYVTDEKASTAPVEAEASSRPESALLSPPRLVPPGEDNYSTADRRSTATLEPPRGGSPSSSMRAASITSTTLHIAEAVRLERPRTRVLAMVETFETRSREGSPSGSPGGSPGGSLRKGS